jgi:predicted small secreted protein
LGWKKFLLGVSAGVAATFLIQTQLNREFISAEKALKIVKDVFKKDGPIEGSWISTTRDSYEDNGVIHEIYRGGVSKKTEGHLSHYEFIINAKTGTLMKVEKEEA